MVKLEYLIHKKHRILISKLTLISRYQLSYQDLGYQYQTRPKFGLTCHIKIFQPYRIFVAEMSFELVIDGRRGNNSTEEGVNDGKHRVLLPELQGDWGRKLRVGEAVGSLLEGSFCLLVHVVSSLAFWME